MIKGWKYALICVLCLLWIAPGMAEAPMFSPELLQHIDGSTSTIPLSEAIAVALMGMTPEEAALAVTHSTTPSAYERLAYDDSGIRLIFVTPPSAEEVTSANVAGREMELVPIARDALVVLNNAENPVTGLTVTQIRDIYQGEITNWADIGGKDEPIIAYARPLNSGSQTLFLELLMKGLDIQDPPSEKVADTMGYLIDLVSSYQNAAGALGYSVYYYVNNMYGNDRIRMLAIDGVAPSDETIATGEYPLCSYYYAVLPAHLDEDAQERRLVAYLQTEEGQRIVRDAGYVPLFPLAEETP